MYTPPTPEATDTEKQNFAISRVSRHGERRQESADSARAAMKAAWLRWWGLFCEPDAWSDPEKRRAMLCARLDYQHAVLGTLSQ